MGNQVDSFPLQTDDEASAQIVPSPANTEAGQGSVPLNTELWIGTIFLFPVTPLTLRGLPQALGLE